MRWVDSLPDTDVDDLARAAKWLGYVLEGSTAADARILALAGAIIRNHRKALGIESGRGSDFPDNWTDEKLIWYALLSVSAVGKGSVVPGYLLRTAEAALRTLWRRGQS